MGEAGIAGNAFGQPDAVRHRQILEQFFRALVRVEQAQLQIKHRLARHAEQKMPRLDDARMNRADRHLKDAFAFDRAEFVPLALEGRQLRCANQNPCAADRLPASRRAARSGADSGWPINFRPNRSCISRSCQFTAGMALVSEVNSGLSAGTGTRRMKKPCGRVERKDVVKVKDAVPARARRRQTDSPAAHSTFCKDGR